MEILSQFFITSTLLYIVTSLIILFVSLIYRKVNHTAKARNVVEIQNKLQSENRHDVYSDTNIYKSIKISYCFYFSNVTKSSSEQLKYLEVKRVSKILDVNDLEIKNCLRNSFDIEF